MKKSKWILNTHFTMIVFQCPVVWNYKELHKIKLKNIFGGWDSGYENTYSVPRLMTLDRVWCNSLPRLTAIANDVMRNHPFFIISFSKLKTYKHLLFLNSFNQSKIILGHFDILDYKTLHLRDFCYLNKQTSTKRNNSTISWKIQKLQNSKELNLQIWWQIYEKQWEFLKCQIY